MILIVEDDDYKSSQILDVLDEVGAFDLIHVVDNVKEAVRFIKSSIPKKIILDMSLPSHKALPGQGTPTPLPTGGIEVLFQLKSMGLMNLPILILTQYPEIEIEGDSIPVEESAEVFDEIYGFGAISACYYNKEMPLIWKENTIRFMRDYK